MMKLLLKQALLSSFLCISVQQVQAADPAEALAKKSNCLMCHAVDNAVLGPSYKDVAKKYKDDKTAEAHLINKVKAGGSGVWGKMPMPANSPQVKDEDIKTIVKWILTLS
jgi:cytochrome c